MFIIIPVIIIPVRLRVSRRAALVALVGSGWENEWSWVAHMHIIPAHGILSFQVRKLRLSPRQNLILHFSFSLSPSLSLISVSVLVLILVLVLVLVVVLVFILLL